MSVIAPSDHEYFEEHGYVIVPNAVPAQNLEAVIDAVWECLGMDRDNPLDWYRDPLRSNGMVEIYQHQALWDNRQDPRLYQAFCEILGTERLWVSFDRTCLKPPKHPDHPEYDHKGFIHWDADVTRLPLRFGVQGVLYLTDTSADQGGFQCVPGSHRRVGEIVARQPPDRDPRAPDTTDLDVTPIPGRAGDLLIWHRGLLHGNGRNLSDRPRMAQYISMFPAREQDEETREKRIRMWRDRLPPEGKAFPGDPRRWEQEHGKSAELTALGRRLLGLDSWNGTPPAS